MLTFNIVGKNIVGSVNGSPFLIEHTADLWNSMVATQKEYSEVTTFAEAESVFEKFRSLLVKDNKSTISNITPNIVFNAKTETYHLTVNGKTSPVEIPFIFVNKMKYAHDNGLPVDPIVKLLVRAIRGHVVQNLSQANDFLYRLGQYAFQTFTDPDLFEKFTKEGYTKDVAQEMAQVPQTPITMEGLLCTKKVVTPVFDRMRFEHYLDEDGTPKLRLKGTVTKSIDPETGKVTISDPVEAEDWVFQPAIMGTRGDAFYCGSGPEAKKGHEIRIGQRMWLESWDQVNCNNDQICVKGLHQGNQDYINYYETPGTVTLNIFVSPEYIGAIPFDSAEPGVIRTKEGFPHSIKNRNISNRNIYHSSDYAKQTDEVYAKNLTEAVNRFQAEKEEAIKAAEKAYQAKMDKLV